MSKDNTKLHQELVDELLHVVGSHPRIRCWPRVVGVGRGLHNYDNVISYGLPGESDIDGIVAPNGRRLSIEVKTGKGKLEPNQVKYRTMVEKFGGLWIEARLPDNADEDAVEAEARRVLDVILSVA